MATSYTSLLGLALPVTGELSGTWGDTVNDYITQYLDAAVAGTQTISGSQTAVTLSKTTNASLGQAGSGATGSSQYQIINCTGNPGGLLTITAPAASKAYLVLNNTSTNQSVKVVGTGPTTGVTVAAARCALIAWNGSDFELVASTDITALQGTLATTNGGTGLTSFTANGVMYASSTSALTTGSALTFDGTNLGVGTASPNGRLSVAGNITLEPGGSGPVASSRPQLWRGADGFFGLQSGGDTGGAIGFYTSLSGTPTEQMRLTSTGLGIGTSSPTNALSVSGNANITGNTTLGDASTDTVQVNGYMGVGGSAVTNIALKLQNASLSGVTQIGVQSEIVGTSAATTSIRGFNTQVSTAAASYTVPDVYGYSALNPVKGAGSTITNLHGVYIADQTQGTNNYGITSAVSSGTNKWNIYASGTAANYFAGNVGIGTSSPSTPLHVVGTITGTSTIAIGGTPATGGTVRIPNGGSVAFRNAANSANLVGLSIDSSNNLTLREGNVVIDSSGNLGLGVTPSAWSSAWSVIDIKGSGAVFTTTSNAADASIFLSANMYSDGTSSTANAKYKISSEEASMYRQYQGVHSWYTAPSGTAGNAISFTQAMTLDASGNLLVGTTSNSENARLNVQGGYVYLKESGGGDVYLRSAYAGSNPAIQVVSNNPLLFLTNNSERARITSGGEVYIAGTTDQGAYNLQVNGTGVWGAGAYVNGSDARLKENVQTLTDGLSVVTQLRPVTFQYKADYSKDAAVQPGFIAQELQQAMAGKDYVDGVVQAGPEYLNVAYQSLIPVLTKAIQELNAKVEALTAEIQTLKGN